MIKTQQLPGEAYKEQRNVVRLNWERLVDEVALPLGLER